MTQFQRSTPPQVRQGRSTIRVVTTRSQTRHSTSRTRVAPWRNQTASWEDLKALEASLHAAKWNKLRQELEQLTSSELMTRAWKCVVIMHITLCHRVRQEMDDLIKKPKELAMLFSQVGE